MATFIYPPNQVTITGVATEATLLLVLAETQDINAELDTQTPILTDIETNTASADTKLTTTNTELADVNTELNSQTALLTTIDADTGSIDTKLTTTNTELADVNIELNSQTALLTTIDADTGSIDSKLNTLGQKTMANSMPVTLASDQSALPVSGPFLTDAELRATPVPVSGPLTDTELRATAVPVSGPLTDTELRASAVPVSAASLPLPSGAATLVEQQSQTSLLTTIDADTGSIDTKLTTTNAELVLVNTELDSQTALLTTIDADTGSIDTKLTTTNSTLGTIDTSLNNIESDVDELNLRVAGSLANVAHDYIALTYVTVGNGIGEIETVVYKTGGSGGTTVATLTLAYDVNDKLASVTRT
jgi:septal ring factor EnvC (AmiA/AmiB activator)